MPDILIRGAKMPTSCYSCEIGPSDQAWEVCPFFRLTGKAQKAYQSKRHKKCPVSQLPPHGDLIDRDAVDTRYSDPEVRETLMEAPVVVPSERIVE